MKTEIMLLLKTLLLSTSQRNIYKYCRDKKKRARIAAGTVGRILLYVVLMAYSILVCIGYGITGLINAAPVMCSLVISLLSFVFTFFKTNGYLFNFKEYDMLMALPFETKTVAASKFLYMYIKSLPWYLSVSAAMMIGFGIFAKPPVYVYPLWLVLSFFIPVIPMLIAAFLGFLIAKISSGFKKRNIVQTVLAFVIILASFFLRFFLEDLFRNDKVQATLEMISKATNDAAGIYLPAGWFSDAVTKHSLPGILLLIAVSALLFAGVFTVVGRSYRSLNSALKSNVAVKNYKMTTLKKRSVVQAIVYKEFKRMTGSTTYMTNGAVGMILAVLLGIITLVVGFDKIVGIVTNGAPLDPIMLQPAIPFIVYFFVGMMATTVCSPSLEGKNYWILQSLPVEKKTIYKGKMLFNMILTVPFMLISTICLCLSARVPVLNTVLFLILGLVLCAFSTAWGCVCGIKHMRLDWENEVEVIKQGAAVAIYMLPNMIVVMGLVVLVVFLGMRMDHKLLAVIFILIAAALAALSYRRAMSLAKDT